MQLATHGPAFAGGGLSTSVHTEVSNTVMAHVLRLVREAAALEEFNRALVRLEARLRPNDAVLSTADHRREHVPIPATGPRGKAGVAPVPWREVGSTRRRGRTVPFRRSADR